MSTSVRKAYLSCFHYLSTRHMFSIHMCLSYSFSVKCFYTYPDDSSTSIRAAHVMSVAPHTHLGYCTGYAQVQNASGDGFALHCCSYYYERFSRRHRVRIIGLLLSLTPDCFALLLSPFQSIIVRAMLISARSSKRFNFLMYGSGIVLTNAAHACLYGTRLSR